MIIELNVSNENIQVVLDALNTEHRRLYEKLSAIEAMTNYLAKLRQEALNKEENK